MKATEHELWQDERAAVLRERDRQREPSFGRAFLVRRPHAGPPPRTVRLSCPQCNGPVFAMTDSVGELVTCTHPDCHAELRTRMQGGAIVVVQVEPDDDLQLIRMTDADGIGGDS